AKQVDKNLLDQNAVAVTERLAVLNVRHQFQLGMQLLMIGAGVAHQFGEIDRLAVDLEPAFIKAFRIGGAFQKQDQAAAGVAHPLGLVDDDFGRELVGAADEALGDDVDDRYGRAELV